ncbi:MAG TPA: xylulokinase [Candidatus Sumerlaeota bacterium]|nr:MAG: Xylulose kinase [candidate division BRC1 bacterium ADurb.Bin183]HOE63922.1 xylulokinase [Candidatus Sumerlaeota bacterium]HRR32178.1 xylulokinase [Candidatus Sumerlaeia bacterium]HON51208.1 xylulokinase [Candidatus Sumerlaeota bacterium]HOR64475.1 xylulokinase [Candidatus Sumerlaeota bacterium]
MIFIGIDSGTQSTKALAADGNTGRILATASHPTPLIENLPPGHKEQHPEDWWNALKIAMNDVLKKSGVNPKDVRGIGVSGQQHGFVPLDKDGRVIRPAKIWCDTSTAQQCEEILERVGGLEHCIQLIGNGVPAGFTASKILWLKENEPKNYARLHTVLLPHDYLNFRLTGERRMEWGDASGTSLMDVRSRQWRRELVNAIDPALMEKLPPLAPSWEPAGIVQPSIADEFGFSYDVIVSAGGGDNMMGAIGTGNVRTGIVTASLGTSGTIYAYSESPVIDPQGEIAAFCDSTGKWLPLLCVMNVTVSTELARALFDMNFTELDAAVEKTPVGAGGLCLLPYFEGERTPNVPDGTGVLFGINARTFEKAHIARAAMEGATMTMNYGLNRLRELGINAKEIRLTGGGSKSAVWRRILADVFDAEVVAMEHAEGAAYGGAIQARWAFARQKEEALSIEKITAEWVKMDERTRVSPNKNNAAFYTQLQTLHDQISFSLRSAFHAHRQITWKTS